jgi:hypothetical protein
MRYALISKGLYLAQLEAGELCHLDKRVKER